MLPAIAAATFVISTLGLPAFAADDPKDVVDEVVEDMAAEQAEDGEAAGAEMGEASYNIENCEQDDDDDSMGEDEGAEDGVEEDAGVEADDLDAECEPMKK